MNTERRGARHPLVSPEVHRDPIMDLPPNALRRVEKTVVRKVKSLQKTSPVGIWVFNEMPPMLCEQGKIKTSKISKAQSSLALGLTVYRDHPH